MNDFRGVIPPLARRLLLLFTVLSTAFGMRVTTALADAPGIPIPTSAEPLTYHSMRVKWKNTTDPTDGWAFQHEFAAFFNLRYRVQGAPDDFSSYTYIAGGGPPDDRSVVPPNVNPLPNSRTLGQILTYDVDGLEPLTTYCFSARTYALEMDLVNTYYALSPWSGEVCAQTPEKVLRIHPIPGIIALEPHGPPDPKAPVSPGLGPAMQPYPDLVAVKIDGPQTLRDGVAQTYQAVIRNDGSATTGMEAQINFSGSVEAWNLPQPATAAGMTCTELQPQTGTAFSCKGGTIISGQTVSVQFQAHAAKPGAGEISLVLNPARTLTETDYTNDVASLKMTVQ